MTTKLFLERTFDEPLTIEDVSEGGRELKWCLDVHRCEWHGSFLALDGRTMICSFSAPDMESARVALRDPDMDLSRLWPGTSSMISSNESVSMPIPRTRPVCERCPKQDSRRSS